jgi:hypothetical protein
MKTRFSTVALGFALLLLVTLSVQPTQTASGKVVQGGPYKVFLPFMSKAPMPIPAKGVAVDAGLAVPADLAVLGALWCYDFSPNPTASCSTGWDMVESVAMAWPSSVGHMGGSSQWILGFNEPNNPDPNVGGYVTPQNAVAPWHSLRVNNPGRKFVSPAPYEGFSNPPFLSGIDWLSQFWAAYTAQYGVAPFNAIGFHCYWQVWDRPGNQDCLAVFQDYLNLAASLGITELRVTEVNFMSGGPCNTTGYDWMQSANSMVAFIKAHPQFTHYAWFTDRVGSHNGECFWAPLVDSSSALTGYGNWYKTQ